MIAVGSVGLDTDIMTSLAEGTDARPSQQDGFEKLLARFNAGEFDLVAVGRAVLGDAEWVSKVREGRFDALQSFTAADLEFLD